ncbi:MAG: hypothetical protein MJ194_00380 [Clostridia bacterium]|nr:hypothetical protein [Clostridia bacterium]
MSRKERFSVFLGGLYRDNPVFTAALGICCSIFMTYDVRNAFLTGVFTALTLVVSDMVISAMKRVIPKQVRIPCHMLLIFGSLTFLQFMLNAYFPMFESGINKYFLPVAVSCLVLGRAEGYAIKNSVINSGVDALGVGIGFTVNLVLIAILRDVLGNGMFFGTPVFSGNVKPVSLFAMAPGVLFISGCICALVKKIAGRKDGGE